MSVLSQFFPRGGGAAVSDPRKLPKAIRASGSVTDGATNLATGATFFTNLAAQGVAVNTDFTASTYKTILSVSGAGEMINAVTPTLASSTHTCDVEITVDGASAIVITFTAAGSAERGVLGGFGIYTSQIMTNPASLADFPLDSTKRFVNSGSIMLGAPSEARKWDLLRLRFDVSLLVRMRTSNNITATANNERQSGVSYILD